MRKKIQQIKRRRLNGYNTRADRDTESIRISVIPAEGRTCIVLKRGGVFYY